MLSEVASLRAVIRGRLLGWYRAVGRWGALGMLAGGFGIYWLSVEMYQQRVGTGLFKLTSTQWQGLTKALNAGYEAGSLLIWLGATAVICGCYCALLREWPNPREHAMRRALYVLLLEAAAVIWLLLVLTSIMPLLLAAWRQGQLITPLIAEVALNKGQQYLMEFLQPAVWLLAVAALAPARLWLVWLWSVPLLLAPKVRDVVCAIIEILTGKAYGRDYLAIPLTRLLDQVNSPWMYNDYLLVPTGTQWHWLAGAVLVALVLVAFRLRSQALAYALLAVCALSAAWLFLASLLPCTIAPEKPKYFMPPQVLIQREIHKKNVAGDSRAVAVSFGSSPAIFATSRLASYYQFEYGRGTLVLSGPISGAIYDYPHRSRHVAWLVNLGWVLVSAALVLVVLLGSRKRICQEHDPRPS